jgi:2'-5' RNA ligase
MSPAVGQGTVRLFIALPVSDPVKHELSRVQAELRRTADADAVRWTRPDQMHLTLRFLGNVPVTCVDELVQSVRSTCASRPSLRLRAEGAGFFPNERTPHVVWVGVRDGVGGLALMHAAVSEASAPFTTEKEEGHFTGHLTLGRIKSIRPAPARALAEAAHALAERNIGEWHVTSVEIIRSELTSDGSRYTRVAGLPLGA